MSAHTAEIDAPESDPLACCQHCEGAPTSQCWVADSIDGHAEPCSECAIPPGRGVDDA